VVCDYGDQHKNKEWQPYAAAMAAAYAKAIIREIAPTANQQPTNSEYLEPRRHLHIPLHQNRKFIGRNSILETLQEKLFFRQECQRLAISGLGGMGKTQVALEFAYWVKEHQLDYSILWIPAFSHAGFNQAYTAIGDTLGATVSNPNDDLKTLVRKRLESDGKWFLVVDDVDEMDVLFGLPTVEGGINGYIPDSDNCLVLFTTRSPDVAGSIAGSDVVELDEMDPQEAFLFFEKSVLRPQLCQNKKTAKELLQELTHLPLAIAQAAAYLNRNRHVSISRYLELLRNTEEGMMNLMSREFRDGTLFLESQSAVATTWLMSFDRIQQSDKDAGEIL
jgi:hypothetical protein